MASPVPNPVGGNWNANHQGMPPKPDMEDSSLHVRPMGLKVQYTFDKDGQINCLARHPHTIHVQTMAIDETSTIGVVDLRLCIQAVAECSPELASHDGDYTIYASDYSEADTPLVGQGLLSRAFETLRSDLGGQASKLVTGRVVKNLLGVFGNGNREILEVKLKLTETAKVQRSLEESRHLKRPLSHPTQMQPHQYQQQTQQQMPHQPQPQYGHPYPLQQHQDQLQHNMHHVQHGHQQQQQSSQGRSTETAMTPTGTAEWTSFIQSNPHIGQPNAYSRVASPALSQGQPVPMHERRGSSIQPTQETNPQDKALPSQQPPQKQAVQRIPPTPVNTSMDGSADVVPSAPPSRPTSRASTTRRSRPRKPPTGRPRGRPRKNAPDGNTSGYEDGTEGEDGGPNKKRAKTTQVDKTVAAPFGAGPDSLRVAASTSGSLRTFRPLNIMSNEATGGNHLQEIPRAPTPVPQGLPGPKRAGGNKAPIRRESSMNQELSMSQPSPHNDASQRTQALSPSQEDGRSPELNAPTPAYSDFSATDIASSPPMPRRASSIGCALSSPTLPPMRDPSKDDEMADDVMEDLFGHEPARPQALPKAAPTSQPKKAASRRATSTCAVPMQVFRMDAGPDGRSMEHICSYNTPEPGSSALLTSDAAPTVVGPTLPAAQTSRRSLPPNNQALPPTPPLTTDAPEKAGSPAVASNCGPGTPQAEVVALAPGELAHSIEQEAPASLARASSDMHGIPIPGPGTSFDTFEPSGTIRAQPTDKAPKPATSAVASLPKLAPKPVRSQSAGIQSEVPKAQSQAPPKPSLPPRAASTLPVSVQRPRGGSPTTTPPTVLLPVPTCTTQTTESASRQVPNSRPATVREASPTLEQSTLTSALATSALPAAPASDSIVPHSTMSISLQLPAPLALPTPDPFVPLASSPNHRRSNKNKVKKETIRQRLEEAIKNGTSPLYCANCGAIETPTWRKVWVQDRMGPPPPNNDIKGTVYEGIQQDQESGETIAHRVYKKNLDPGDDESQWYRKIICNPCGLWLSKGTGHRPQEKWDKTIGRRGQDRKRRAAGSKARLPRSGSDADAQAVRPMLGLAPMDGAVPPTMTSGILTRAATEPIVIPEQSVVELDGNNPAAGPAVSASDLSKGVGTAKSPITLDVDDEMGLTKRILFPSPRKDESPKVLGDVNVNIVHVSNDARQHRELEAAKDGPVVEQQKAGMDADDLEALFRSPAPPPRPSTPTPDTMAGPPATVFKTPTRSTPSRRPMTRSVSRSQRTVRPGASPNGVQKTPSRTPSRTPREHLQPPETPVSRRRSPRNQPNAEFGESEWNTPISRAITQLLSDNPELSEENFASFSDDMDFSDLPPMDDQVIAGAVESWFSTDPDMMMEATSPRWYDGSKDVVDEWEERTSKEFAEKCVRNGV